MKQGFFPPPDGWQRDDDAVVRVLEELSDAQGVPAVFAQAAPEIMAAADDDKPFLAWQAEVKLYGAIKPSWNQGSVGTCVSFGWGRGANDCLLNQALQGAIDAPEADVATEPIYALSRVEVGGGRIRGDGSVGAWAAKAAAQWGMLLRKMYGSHDLTRYSESRSRQWGQNGLPDELEPMARQFPIKMVAQCRGAREAWAGLGNGYLLPVCSGVGFQGSPLRDGFCDPRGSWAHCMLIRGRVVAKRRGNNVRAYACQNSWGSYLDGDPHFIDADGAIHELPSGCFLMEESVMERILSEGDSFLISDVQGFPRRDPMDWLI